MALIVVAPLWAGEGSAGGTSLGRGLQSVTREHAFSLVRWEIEALAGSALRVARPAWSPGLDLEADRRVVRRYVELTEELARLQRERNQIEATAVEPRRSERRAALGQQAEAMAAERRDLAVPVEAIISWQIEQVLAEQGIRRSPLEAGARSYFPYLSVRITPGVAFRLGQTPDLLVVAPRDRIEVAGSVLIEPGLSFDDVDRLEMSADRLHVASVVTPIGGLATYPTMVPASSSVRAMLRTVAHEWTHHYLTLRPLGLRYFSSYDLRTINETVADIVGDELAEIVDARYYAPPGEPPDPGARPSSRTPARPSYGDLMRGIRVEVERYLARGDVAGAEAYMAEQRQVLAGHGYYVRRLNTAYLSFFGAYAGSANPYEADLQTIRRQSESLYAFLEATAGVRSIADLEALAAR